MKILIADDNAFFRRMLESTLTECGYDVWAVANGEAAWEALHRHDAPRLAIIDWMMPNLDGPELCRRLRNTAAGRAVYVIILTSKEGRADAVAGLQAGADDFVRKPFDREELQARLNVGVRIVGLQEELADKLRLLETALLADHLTQVVPDLKVLFISGYTDDLALRQSLESSGQPFLQKPFGAAALTAKIRAILDSETLVREEMEARSCVS